jgi:hypothetical protein
VQGYLSPLVFDVDKAIADKKFMLREQTEDSREEDGDLVQGYPTQFSA